MEIDEYVDLYFGNPITKKQYKSYLKLYYEFLGMKPKDYWKQKREHNKDILKYWQKCLKTDSPNTIPQRMSVIRGYYEENGIIFTPRFWRNLNKRGLGYENVLEDRIPTIKELQQIMEHCKDAREKAFFLMMLSSGIRETEMITIKIKDINFNLEPVMIKVSASASKTKKKRFTFISMEAKNALLEWLKIRDKYLQGLKRRTQGLYNYLENQHGKKIAVLKEDYVFPFKPCTVRTWWNRMLDKAGYDELDEATQMRVLHLYVLRKYFNTKMKKKCNNTMVEMWMGHKIKYDYEKWTLDEHKEEYLKGMDDLLVYRTPANIEELEKLKEEAEQLKAKDREIKEMREEMAKIREDVDSYKDLAKTLESLMDGKERKPVPKK